MKEFNQNTDKNPFSVPENYFDEVNRKILARTLENKGIRPSGILSRLRPFIAAAAVITGLIILSYAGMKIFAPAGNKMQAEILLTDSTDLYINDIDLSNLEQSAALFGIEAASTDVSSNDIIEYLLLENIDVREIYEHL